VDPLVVECIQQIDAHAEQSMFICQCATPNQQELIGGLQQPGSQNVNR
jgi:hypothetical protein